MKPLLALVACLLPVAAPADWTPPVDADPKTILDEAREDSRAGRWDDALAKHVWYHENALRLRPSQAGVRLSFALDAWYELGMKYTPAMEKLRELREEAAKKIVGGKDLRQSFMELRAIDRQFDEPWKTKDAFLALHEKDREAAVEVFDVARPSLVEAREFEVCGEYIDPRSIDRAIRLLGADLKLVDDGRVAARHREFAEKMFTNDAATLVALLVVNDRKAEADEVAEKAKAAWDSADFHSAIDDALAGNVPEPWPSRRRGR